MSESASGRDLPALERPSREQLGADQWTRFRDMAHVLLGANPFVRRAWGAAGVDSVDDLRSWDDFARLPFMRKRDFVDDQAEHPPFGTNLTYPLERYVRVHQTSGTSGQPIRWLDTQDSWEWWQRCWGFVLRGAGLGSADRIFFPFSFGLFIGFWAGFEGARALGALAIPGGGQDSPTRLACLEALGVTALVCTPSYALHLVEVARERGIDPAKLPVRATVHAGEPGAGIPAVRARIEEGWGARAYDHAGMTEMGAYGYECAEQTGLHVNESEFIAEILDPATGAPADDGELVLTNLGRVGSPVIRYRTGDRVRHASRPCPCGRTFLQLEGGILGRLDDMLIVRGVNVFPSAIEGIVRRFHAVDEFQIEVFRDGHLDEVRVLVELADTGAAGAVQEALRVGLGIRLEVACVPPRSLPASSSKRGASSDADAAHGISGAAPPPTRHRCTRRARPAGSVRHDGTEAWPSA
jgi:phenylacetate-CoA ligase